ncbi:MAG TPA: methyltransferase domain-containing protein [Thermoplasmataceae archaeon]|nr:methyltransferase domain-containing protein [Thermoplasmataceae archaeon]
MPIINPGDTLFYRGEEYTAIDGNHSYSVYARSRRTQIMQPWDIAFFVDLCNIGSESRVLESGLGTGNLSRIILSRLGEKGQLVTVEKSPEIIDSYRSSHESVDRRWSIVNADIEQAQLDGMFNAVLLDIPEPWKAVSNIDSHLVPGSFFCSYVPTFNQLEKIYLKLEESGYEIIETSRLLREPILVRRDATRPDNRIIGHTGFICAGVRKSGFVVQI